MTKINVEIDLSHLGISADENGEPIPGPAMEELIVESLARRMYNEYDASDLRRRAEQLLDDRVEAVIDPIIQEVATGPIQKRARWGDAVGDPTTLREVVREHVEAFINAPESRDSYDRRNRPKSLKDIVANTTLDVLTKDMKEAADTARKEVNNQVKRVILDKVIETLNGGAR